MTKEARAVMATAGLPSRRASNVAAILAAGSGTRDDVRRGLVSVPGFVPAPKRGTIPPARTTQRAG